MRSLGRIAISLLLIAIVVSACGSHDRKSRRYETLGHEVRGKDAGWIEGRGQMVSGRLPDPKGSMEHAAPNPVALLRRYGNRFITNEHLQNLPRRYTKIVTPADRASTIERCSSGGSDCGKMQDCADRNLEAIEGFAKSFDDYAGVYFGYEEGDYVFLGFSRRPVEHFQAVLKRAPDPNCVRLFPVAYSENELASIRSGLNLDLGGDVHSIGDNSKANAIVIGVTRKGAPALRRELGEEVGDAVVIEIGSAQVNL